MQQQNHKKPQSYSQWIKWNRTERYKKKWLPRW